MFTGDNNVAICFFFFESVGMEIEDDKEKAFERLSNLDGAAYEFYFQKFTVKWVMSNDGKNFPIVKQAFFEKFPKKRSPRTWFVKHLVRLSKVILHQLKQALKHFDRGAHTFEATSCSFQSTDDLLDKQKGRDTKLLVRSDFRVPNMESKTDTLEGPLSALTLIMEKRPAGDRWNKL